MEGIYESLRGKRVLVTGSSRGIGRAIAEGFAKNGCDVAVHGVEPSAHLESLTAELSSCGGKIITVCGDLADPTVPAKLIAGNPDIRLTELPSSGHFYFPDGDLQRIQNVITEMCRE